MSETPRSAPAELPLGIGTRAFAYFAVCSMSLTVLLLIQLRLGHWILFSVLLVVAGVGGLLWRVRFAPLLVVLAVALSEVLRRLFDFSWDVHPQDTPIRPTDILRSAAMLGYVIGHYRLQGLRQHVFPPDYRLSAARPRAQTGSVAREENIERRRPAEAMTPLEEPLFILALPVFALLGELAWQGLSQPHDLLQWDSWVVRLALVVAALVVGVGLTAALLRTWRRRRMTPEEAELMLQDVMWNETRGEQRWFARWLAWFWIKERERKEHS